MDYKIYYEDGSSIHWNTLFELPFDPNKKIIKIRRMTPKEIWNLWKKHYFLTPPTEEELE